MMSNNSMKSTIGSGKISANSGKAHAGSGKLLVSPGKMSVSSRKMPMGSGKAPVGSGKMSADSGKAPTGSWILPVSPKNSAVKKVISCLLVLALAAGIGLLPTGFVDQAQVQAAAPATTWTPVTQQPALVVTGTGILGGDYPAEDLTAAIANERSYTMEDLVAMEAAEYFLYSFRNAAGSDRVYKAKGVTLESLFVNTAFTSDKYTDFTVKAIEPPQTYVVTFDPDYAGALSGPDSVGFYIPRYYFPEATGIQVPVIVATKSHNYGNNNLGIPTDAEVDERSLEVPLLIAGQLTEGQVNSPLFNDATRMILVGDELPAVLPVTFTGDGASGSGGTGGGAEDTVTYTRAELLLMPRYETLYTGTGISSSPYARGVPLMTLLGDGDWDTAEFTIADGANRLISKEDIFSSEREYILAYENRAADATDLRGIYRTSGATVTYFSLYSQGGPTVNYVTGVRLLKGDGGPESEYKHIAYDGAPYNLDAITGATLTVEGPGVRNSVPITVRQLEETGSGNIRRGDYSDSLGARTYEGVRLLSILDGAVHSNVQRLDDDVNVVFRNRWRHEIGRMSYGEIKNAESNNAPVILAYGFSNTDGSNISPFVYDGGAGHSTALGNGDGPMRVVYDRAMTLTSPNSVMPTSGAFPSIAYLYIEEGVPPPGFKHITATDPVFRSPENTEHIITLTGSALGREINFTTRQLQELVTYGADGKPAPGGLGYRDEYSLSNTTYWYVNEYEGVNLWELLVHSGLDRDKYKDDDKTLVSFSAWDNYQISAQFSTQQLANPDLFYFYEKSPLDVGTDRPTKAQLSDPAYHPTNRQDGEGWILDDNGYPIKKGYPVLLAYGVNGYPYVRDGSMPGFRSGLGNHGGPMRVIYGKTDGLNRSNPGALENYAYFFNNGSEQLQKVQEVFVGDDKRFSTHRDNPLPVYQAMADEPDALTVEIVVEEGVAPQIHRFTLAELEEIIYGVDKRVRDNENRQEKGYYFTRTAGGGHIQELFEGVNLEYLLFEHIGLPGRLGSVELYSAGATTAATRYSLSEIGEKGSNFANGLSGNLGMAVVYAKNGYPLVREGSSASPPESGYVHNDPINSSIGIRNNGGPLLFVRGQTDEEVASSSPGGGVIGTDFMVERLEKIVVNLEPDKFAHVGQENEAYAAREIQFSGAVAREGKITVGALETLQRYIVTDAYTVGGATRTYRGLDLLGLLNDRLIGASSLMSEVTIKNGAGNSVTLTRAELAAAITAKKPVILAYGASVGGPPDYAGAASLKTVDGGPMRLISDSGSGAGGTGGGSGVVVDIADVTEIVVSADTLDRWTHSFSPYSQYADYTVEISGQNLKHNRTYTVTAFEAMDSLIAVDEYRIGSQPAQWFQGVDLYRLLDTDIGFAEGLSTSSITVTAADGYSINFDGSQLANGINGKPILLAFGRGLSADNGLPLVPTDKDPGYDDIYGNNGGPIRFLVHDNSGWAIQMVKSIVVGAAGGLPDPNDSADFTVFGLPGGDVDYSIDDLKSMEVKTASYTQRGTAESATGVMLYDLLRSSGVSDSAIVTVNTTDGFENGSSANAATYRDIPMSVIKDQEYMAAFTVDGAPVSDAERDRPDVIATVRVYRRYDDGATTWLNRLTNILGVTVTDYSFISYQTGQNGFPMAGVRSISIDGGGGGSSGTGSSGGGTGSSGGAMWVGTYGGGIAR
ncbi:MAG: hypothetical protein FWH55_03940, partial [Oscillospiraceae bacterium]|nr:hypothetical protein [Oscillospiraceae bacterium]